MNGSKFDEYGINTHQKLNLETAQIGWDELQRFFAGGSLVVVDDSLDLVAVAAGFVDDNSDYIAGLMESGQVRKASDDDARRWQAEQRSFWAVVAAPFVLVQETT